MGTQLPLRIVYMSITKRMADQYFTKPLQDTQCERPIFPKGILIDLANACNHSCGFCQIHDMKRERGRIDRDLLWRIITEAGANGAREIGFYTTGEPFLHKDLPEITAHARDSGFTYIYVSTNGALATPERVKAVIAAGMNSIKFSINAGSRETYRAVHGKDDWDVVNENLRFLSQYKKENNLDLRLYMTCVVNKVNEHEVESIKDQFSPLVDEIMLFDVIPMQYPSRVPGSICRLPFERIHVTCEGYLTICCADYENYLVAGDVNSNSLLDAWHSPAFQDIRRRHLARDLSGTLCGRCWNNDPAPVQPLDPTRTAAIDFERYERSIVERVNLLHATSAPTDAIKAVMAETA